VHVGHQAPLEDEMLDTILLAAGVVGLLLTVAYAYACERM
jgi:hypothetical protein